MFLPWQFSFHLKDGKTPFAISILGLSIVGLIQSSNPIKIEMTSNMIIDHKRHIRENRTCGNCKSMFFLTIWKVQFEKYRNDIFMREAVLKLINKDYRRRMGRGTGNCNWGLKIEHSNFYFQMTRGREFKTRPWLCTFAIFKARGWIWGRKREERGLGVSSIVLIFKCGKLKDGRIIFNLAINNSRQVMNPITDNFNYCNPFLYQMHCDLFNRSWFYPQYTPISLDQKDSTEAIPNPHPQSPQESKNSQVSPCQNKSSEIPLTKIEQNRPLNEFPPPVVKKSNKKGKKQTSNFQLPKNKNQIQKEGRNANSNLLRMFFRRMQQRLELQPEILSRVIRKYKMKIPVENVREWLDINEVNHRNYVRLPDVRELFVGGRNNRQQAKIMRILLKDFLQHEALSCYLTSKKIKRDSMRHNYRSIRYLLKDIFQLTRTS